MPSQSRNRALRVLNRISVALIAVCAVLGQVTIATAEPAASITVKADQAKLVALAGEPATAVIGNALFADITLKEGLIVIHGRQFGTTNVIVLDKNNAELTSFELHVIRGGSKNLTVYKAGSAFSHVCAPVCEGALQVGDNPEHYGAINSGISSKLQLSTSAGQLSR